MIIGIDASQANTRTRTGTEWYSFSILKEWAASEAFQGHEVRLYTRGPLVADFPKLPFHWKVKTLHWPPNVFWSQIRLSIEMLFHKPDVLFVPAHTIPMIHPRNTFTTVHDIGFEDNPELYSSSSVVRIRSTIIQKIISGCIRIVTLGKYSGSELDYQRFSVRYAIKHAKALFTVSEFTKQRLLKRFLIRQPLIVAPNAIDHSHFFFPFPKQRILAVKNKYNLKDYLLSIGRIERKKQSLQLVQAYVEARKTSPHLPDLVFAGSDGFGAEEVHAFVIRHRLEKVVHFLGWIPTEDLAPLLAGATLFCFLSGYEGFGVPVIQSIAVGTPVLASNLSVFHEIASSGIFYCQDNDPSTISDELVKAIKSAWTDSQKQSHADAMAKYDWKLTADIISKTLLSVNLP